MSALNQKVWQKRANATKEGIEFLLTIEQVKLLLEEANISEADWNFRGYHLARFGDKGNYEYGNCRFIPASDNYSERTITDNMRRASRNNMKTFMLTRTPEEQKRISHLRFNRGKV